MNARSSRLSDGSIRPILLHPALPNMLVRASTGLNTEAAVP
jgi:hypothetical protein